MSLRHITAAPHPAGNRIDLAWSNADLAFPGIRIMRSTGSHPPGPQDGTLVVEGEGLTTAADRGLQGETVYYYSLFPYRNTPHEYQVDPANRVSAMASAPYDFAGQMYNLLPTIYRRYDIE